MTTQTNSWNSGLTGPHLNIASYPGSPLRVMAGPGTGKTFAMMRRIARLLESGVSPDSIFAVTFTRTAARDLLEQLNALGNPGAKGVASSTLHSISFSILSKNSVFLATRFRLLVAYGCLRTPISASVFYRPVPYTLQANGTSH